MYAKINGGTVTHFPYTFGQLRQDNSNVSFPRSITATTMQTFSMVGVLEGPQPTPTAYQTVKRNALPTRPVTGQYTEDDAPMPDMVGDDILANYWMINYTAVDMFADTTETDDDGVETTTTKAQHEAAYQVTLDAKTAESNRTARDTLIAATDYFALTDVTMNADMTNYRQALRDITSHANWPNLEEADWPTKP
jgi:hypothetical protein